MLTLRKPYLLFLGAAQTRSEAKTALGVADWCPDDVVGETSLPGATVSTGFPSMTIRDAADKGAGSLLLGTAPVGGQLPQAWVAVLLQAIDAGLDVVSGLHVRLSDIPALVEAAARKGVKLHDVRHVRWPQVTGTGIKRSGQRVLAVGTDCALGKKYTTLALSRELTARGVKATFRATGQTGIMISGGGVALDAVVSDFVAGVAEQLSPANDADHWDVIEGQGSLYHPAYAGVTLGLLHGSQPDALVLCHDPSRSHIQSCPGTPIQPLDVAMDGYLRLARLTNAAARFAGISINSSSLSDAAWAEYREALSRQFGLPVVDPMRGGVAALADALLQPVQ